MPVRAPLIFGLVSVASLAGQTQFTSPLGVGLDGDSAVSSLQPFNTAALGRRFQYVVDDVRDLPGVGGEPITQIALRPDPAAPLSAARTVTLTMVFDHTAFPVLSSTFAANYSGNEITYPLGAVSLPATTGGAGYVIVVPLPMPFLYFGSNNTAPPASTALLVEFQTTGVAGGTNYSLDCADGSTQTSVGTSIYLGLQPCVVPPNVGGFDIIKHGPTTSAGQTTFAQHGLRGPASTFGILALSPTDPNTDFGGVLCAPLRASPDIQVNVTSDTQGSIGGFANPVRLTLRDLFVGQSARLYAQFVMFDPARAAPQLSVSLSDAIQFDLMAPTTIDRKLIYSTTSATATVGTMTPLFVPVMRFN